MSNVIRGDQLAGSGEVVEIPLTPGVRPQNHAEGERRRLEIHGRLMREAREKTRAAREFHESETTAARREAESILARAREQASAIVAGANREKDRIEEQARASGRAAAEAEARRAALERVSEGLKVLEAAAADLRALKRDYLASAAAALPEILGLCLETILRGRVEVDRELVLRTIDGALAEITGADRITVRVNPEDLGAAEDYRGAILDAVRGLTDVEVQPDPGITRGGVLVETSYGRVDARIETQAQELLREARVVVRPLSVLQAGDGAE